MYLTSCQNNLVFTNESDNRHFNNTRALFPYSTCRGKNPSSKSEKPEQAQFRAGFFACQSDQASGVAFTDHD